MKEVVTSSGQRSRSRSLSTPAPTLKKRAGGLLKGSEYGPRHGQVWNTAKKACNINATNGRTPQRRAPLAGEETVDKHTDCDTGESGSDPD